METTPTVIRATAGIGMASVTHQVIINAATANTFTALGLLERDLPVA